MIRSGYDVLGTVQYDGNPLTRSLAGLPTIVSANDVANGAGGSAAQNAAATAQAAYANVARDGQGIVPSSRFAMSPSFGPSTDGITVNTPSAMPSSASGADCSQYTIGSWDWSQCMGQKASTAVGSIFSPITDTLNRGLFGVLGLIVVALGLWLTFAE